MTWQSRDSWRDCSERALHANGQTVDISPCQSSRSEAQHTKTTTERQRIKDELRQALLDQQTAETAWQAACAQHQQAKQRLVEAEQRQGIILADDAFFSSRARQAAPSNAMVFSIYPTPARRGFHFLDGDAPCFY